MFRFIHAADIHLDSPLRGLAQREDAPVADIRSASRRALENLVSLAIAEKVDFVVIAGDIYDGDWPDYNTGLFFTKQMAELHEAGINVYLISGNHDASSRITRQLQPPENVYVFPVTKPTSVTHPTLPVTLHGQGFATPAVTENLSLGYPEPTANTFNIGILHCSIGDSPHAPYAPCSLADLRGKQYDYWALGHIHQRAVLSQEPYIVYSGNIQGRHARETGAKGCYVVEVDADLSVASHTFHPLDTVRWTQIEIDLSENQNYTDLLAQARTSLEKETELCAPRLLCCRITLTGRTKLHAQFHHSPTALTMELVNLAQTLRSEIWLEKVQLKTKPSIDISQLANQSELTSQVISALESLQTPSTAGSVADLLAKLPAEAAAELDSADLAEDVAALVLNALAESA